jgi:2-desacetyl-2-hydroxyethyl bacteriochlorophyllide A dehydrogenase
LKAKQLWFTKPYSIEIREQDLELLKPGEVLVRSICSAISAGTEQLVYRGQLPVGINLDTSLETLKGKSAAYPLQYGYASVGIIEQAESKEDEILIGKHIFAYQPHSSHFNIPTEQLIFLPENVETDAAVFLANMETAVNLVLDGNPKLGESVIVIGQGIAGLLLSGILNEFPLSRLYTLDNVEKRRNTSELLGVTKAYDPTSQKDMNELNQLLDIENPNCGSDLVFEVSGSPETINLAIDLCGYNGRIVVGSWYGTKSADIQLGGKFHRNRIKITSSQVSTIAPELSGRWDKARRFKTTWEMIRTLKPERLISHRIPFESAADAYQLLDKSSSEVLQTLLVYPN